MQKTVSQRRKLSREHNSPHEQARVRYDLETLLSQCNFHAPAPKDLEAWDQMRPVAREIC